MKQEQLSPNLPLPSLNLTPFTIGRPGQTPDAITGLGYELRSQGPPTLGTNALDIRLHYFTLFSHISVPLTHL